MSDGGWNVDTLKEYVDKLREADQRALLAALASADKRLDGMNEFRQQLTDQTASFLTRAEADARISAATEKIDVNSARLERIEGRHIGSAATFAVALSIIGLMIAAATLAILTFT